MVARVFKYSLHVFLQLQLQLQLTVIWSIKDQAILFNLYYLILLFYLLCPFDNWVLSSI